MFGKHLAPVVYYPRVVDVIHSLVRGLSSHAETRQRAILTSRAPREKVILIVHSQECSATQTKQELR